MRRIIFLTILLVSLTLPLVRLSPPFAVRASAARPEPTPVASVQAQSPRPIRALPGLEAVHVWVGRVPLTREFFFPPNHPQILERLAALGNPRADMAPFGEPGDYYDVFYSNADGTPNVDGAYVTLEAVSNQQASGLGGGNVIEVGLRFSGSTTFEFGNAVASFVALGSNANPALNVNAIDGHLQTCSVLGNTVGQSELMRITIGFLSSSGTTPAVRTVSIEDTEVGEANAGTANAVFKVRLSSPSPASVTVAYSTADFTAIAPNDYSATSGTLTFPANSSDTLMTITVPVREDSLYEAAEQFFVNLTGPVNAGIGRGQATGTIIDNDPGVMTVCGNDLPKQISGSGPVTSTITVNSDVLIDDVNVSLMFSYPTGVNELEKVSIRLVAPNQDSPISLVVPSSSTLGRPTDVVGHLLGTTCSPAPDCVFDDDSRASIYEGFPPYSGIFHPGSDDSLEELERRSARGDWTLIVNGKQGGTIQCWCLRFELPREGCNLHPARARVPIFHPHTVRARLTENGVPVANQTVDFEVRGERGEVRFSKQQTSDVTGQATLHYYDFAPGENFIEARAVVNGVPSIARAQVTWVADGLAGFNPVALCPVEESTAGTPGAEVTLTAARRFRDDVLARSARGKAYTNLYYKFSSEAVPLMLFNPMLMLRSREIIERYKPVIQAMANGEPVTLTRGDLDEIDGFLNRLAARGSPQFQQAVKAVCEDLRDPQVHEEFQITVTEGPKRELPARHSLQQISRAGGAALFIGFLLIFGRGLRRTGKSKAKARRWLCLMLAMLIAQPANVLLAHASVRDTTRRDHSHTAASAAGDRKGSAMAIAALDKLPLRFEANQGQTDSPVKFMSRGDGYSLFLRPTEATIRLRAGGQSQPAATRLPAGKALDENPGTFVEMLHPKSERGARQSLNRQAAALRMTLVGANPAARMAGVDELPGRTNYFIGKDPARWRANVPAYARVACEQVYPGIDMVYYGSGRNLEYDFQLAPGADYRAIKLKFDGAERVEIDPHGDLVISTACGAVRQRKPVAYQMVNGARREVTCHYELIQNPKSKIQNSEVGFEIGAYDPALPLIVDPVLAYATYLGGSGDDEGNSITGDSAGNLYVVGFTDSIDFPTAGASQPAPGGGRQDGFVAKLNPSGTQLIYSTYLGGDGHDNGSGIAVDSAGNAYITGFTSSTNFPVRNALQPTRSGIFNSFVMKLGPTGGLLYSTHLGGSASDYGSSIAVDPSGNVYVAGVATSTNFPLAGAAQQQIGGGADVYIAKLNASGRRLVYSTYLGGGGDDGATGIAVDASGGVYVTGVTASPNFKTASPLQAAHGGGVFDAFVARLNPAGQLVYSTYLGGNGEDRGFRVAVDPAGNAYVTGDTDSINFPTAGVLQKNISGSVDAFVAKLNSPGTQLVYSTYLGGGQIDGGTAIAVNSAGSAYVAGFTGSTNFPTVNPVQPSYGGGSFDGFIAKLNAAGTALDYSTYLGGNNTDAAFGVAVDAGGNAYLMGQTVSPDFPIASPLQPSYGGGGADVFVARITTASGPHIDGGQVNGKKLLVTGSGFDQGAKILLNGQPQKTINDDQNPTALLIGKKAGKQISAGQTVTLQVRNAGGELSNEFNFTRPAP